MNATDREVLERLIAEKHEQFLQQAVDAHWALKFAPGDDRFWGDRVYSIVAVAKSYRVAELGLELVALQEAVNPWAQVAQK